MFVRRRITPVHLRASSLALALPVALLGITTLFNSPTQSWVAHGPILQDHKELACTSCHSPSRGTIRQQIQANIRYTLGLRADAVDFGYAKVSSEQCLDCHERDNERHPIYRFNEPRFAEVLHEVAANSCLGCHSEHANQRSFADIGFCRNCHEDLALKSDPLDIPHMTLIDDGNWTSCLGCHDFHGNHERRTQKTLAEAYDATAIASYLMAGPSPYGDKKIFEGKSE